MTKTVSDLRVRACSALVLSTSFIGVLTHLSPMLPVVRNRFGLKPSRADARLFERAIRACDWSTQMIALWHDPVQGMIPFRLII